MKTISIVKYLFAALGLAMLIGALFLYQNTQNFLAEAVSSEGVVVALERRRSSDSTTYSPVVEFTAANGSVIEFTSSTSSNPPSYSEGEAVEVLYQPGEPQRAKIKGLFSLYGGVMILSGLGGIFFLIGAGMIGFGILKNKRATYLKQYGVPVMAKYQQVELNRGLEVNGRHPFRISAQWQNPKTQQLHIFHSENLWFDPSEYIDCEDITVLIDRNNPKKYYMDTSFLPQLTS